MSLVYPFQRAVAPPAVLKALGRWWLLLVLILAVIMFSSLRPQMIEASNQATVLRSASLTAIMVLGMTWVFAAGKIDVSFMQIGALANMTGAALIASGAGWTIAVCAGLAIGLAVGAFNGLLIGTLRFSPLITTIATGGICGSVAAAIGKGTSIRIDQAGPLGDLLAATLGPVPLIAVITALLYTGAWWCQEHLTFGRYVYAIAENEEALLEAGVSTSRLILILYILSGFAAASAGILLIASLSSGQPMIGTSFFIDGLTAVLVGAMMIRFGQPNVIGTLTAVLLLAALVSGGALLGWPDYVRQIIKGAILICGVALAVRIGLSSRTASGRA